MTSLQELLAQQAALNQKIAEMQRESRAEAINKVKALMTEYGLTIADITQGVRNAVTRQVTQGTGSRAVVAAKYRNAATGETWSGRGLKPKWLAAALAGGAKLEDFSIAAQEPAPVAHGDQKPATTTPVQALAATVDPGVLDAAAKQLEEEEKKTAEAKVEPHKRPTLTLKKDDKKEENKAA